MPIIAGPWTARTRTAAERSLARKIRTLEKRRPEEPAGVEVPEPKEITHG